MKRHIISVALVLVGLAVLYHWDACVALARKAYATVSSGGFHVVYFDSDEFIRPLASRSERHLVRDYGSGRPYRTGPSGSYAARWEGWLRVPDEGTYAFFLQSTKGARVYLNGELLIDHWDSPGWFSGMHAEATLERKVYHVRVDHHVEGGPGAIRLRWAGNGVATDTTMGVPHVTKRRPRNDP